MSARCPETGTATGRRGTVIVQVALLGTVLFGFAALTIDIGAMYVAKSELQRAADAAALGAAAKLADFSTGDPKALSRYAALDLACRNEVLQGCTGLENADVAFGVVSFDSVSGAFDFTADDSEPFPEAVRVTVRREDSSPSGPMTLFFAPIFGKSTTSLRASATAVLVPRDIAVVADLSGSTNDDSELGHYKITQINLWNVWDAMPGGIDGGATVDDPPEGYDPLDPANMNLAGPAFGDFMEQNGFGEMDIDIDYDPTTDDGLTYLPYNQNWTSNTVIENLLADRGYIQDEIDALLNKQYDKSESSKKVWENRVAVALGLADWRSGKTGGLWEQQGWSDPGNGNNYVGSGELTWNHSYPYQSGSWREYIDSYMSSSSTAMENTNSDFRYRFGVKTFMNFLLERKRSNNQTPELANTPTQPVEAIKEAVEHMMQVVADLDSEDMVSLEIYARTTNHEVDLTQNYYEVSNRLNAMQAGHYDTWTNMGGGIVEGYTELTGPRGRPNAAKVMILLTDGIANTVANGSWNVSAARQWAKDEAAIARSMGIRIYTISVGAAADVDLMQEIAEIGDGEHFHAEGSIEDYSAQLDEIFVKLGGKRPVMLIE